MRGIDVAVLPWLDPSIDGTLERKTAFRPSICLSIFEAIERGL